MILPLERKLRGDSCLQAVLGLEVKRELGAGLCFLLAVPLVPLDRVGVQLLLPFLDPFDTGKELSLGVGGLSFSRDHQVPM